MIYDYLIIGAGISGLYANYLLKQHDATLQILLLESSDRIGGRIFTQGRSSLGAKFLHQDADIPLVTSLASGDSYYLGSLTNRSRETERSMRLEEYGSLSKNLHPQIDYINEVNTRYNYQRLVDLFAQDAEVRYQTPFRNYGFQGDQIVVNQKYSGKRLIFAIPICVLNHLSHPYQMLSSHWTQTKVITVGLELERERERESTPCHLTPGFFFNDRFNDTSFFYDPADRILYVNLYQKPEELRLDTLIQQVVDAYQLAPHTVDRKIQRWSSDPHFLGGWSIPTRSLTSEIIKKIQGGYQDKIYYVGDYLGEISEIGTVNTAMKSAELVVAKLSHRSDAD